VAKSFTANYFLTLQILIRGLSQEDLIHFVRVTNSSKSYKNLCNSNFELIEFVIICVISGKTFTVNYFLTLQTLIRGLSQEGIC
jgi:hypothetical protein